MNVRFKKPNWFQMSLTIIILGFLVFLFTYQPKTQNELIEIPEIEGSSVFTQEEDRYFVYFYQPRCVYCQQFEPILSDYLKQENPLPIYKINIQGKPELWAEFEIQGTPTLLDVQTINGERQYAEYIGVLTLEELNDISTH